MAPTKDPIESYLTSALAGSMVGLLACKRSLTIDELLALNSERLVELQNELVDLGLFPRELACQSLNALVALFVEEHNANFMVNNLTSLLWNILGDPENGGEPPEIYRRAGVAMHLMFIALLTPSSFSDKSND